MSLQLLPARGVAMRASNQYVLRLWHLLCGARPPCPPAPFTWTNWWCHLQN